MTPLEITGYSVLAYFVIGIIVGVLVDIRAAYKKKSFGEVAAYCDAAGLTTYTQVRIVMFVFAIVFWPMGLVWICESKKEMM